MHILEEPVDENQLLKISCNILIDTARMARNLLDNERDFTRKKFNFEKERKKLNVDI